MPSLPNAIDVQAEISPSITAVTVDSELPSLSGIEVVESIAETNSPIELLPPFNFRPRAPTTRPTSAVQKPKPPTKPVAKPGKPHKFTPESSPEPMKDA